MEKWRHLIEPVIAESATPMSWDEFLQRPKMLFEGAQSVLVTTDTRLFGESTRFIWIAAGDLNEVLGLARQAEESAKADGISRVGYLGRSGFVRAAKGYRVASVIAVKEI